MADDRTLAARLPGPLGELARRGHGGAALILVREWGGTKRSVPSRLFSASPLVDLIGYAATTALIDICGPCRLDIPSRACLEGSRKAAVIRETGSTREIAQATGVTERYVRMVRNAGEEAPQSWRRPARQKPKDERQIDLEDFLKRD